MICVCNAQITEILDVIIRVVYPEKNAVTPRQSSPSLTNVPR